MTLATLATSNVVKEAVASPEDISRQRLPVLEILLQICMFFFLVVSYWYLLLSEPLTQSEHQLQIGLLALAYNVLFLAWLALSRWSLKLKFALFVLNVGVNFLCYWSAVSEFEQSVRVLDVGTIDGDRIVHQSLGFSYSKPLNSQETLTARLLQARPDRQKKMGAAPKRLLTKEVAILDKITLAVPPDSPISIPSTVSVLIARHTFPSFSNFHTEVIARQLFLASLPNTRITKPTHRSQVGDQIVYEFEYVDTKKNIVTRQVNFHIGLYMATFAISTVQPEDMKVFDEILQSIRFESPENRSAKANH